MEQDLWIFLTLLIGIVISSAVIVGVNFWISNRNQRQFKQELQIIERRLFSIKYPEPNWIHLPDLWDREDEVREQT